MMVIAKHKSLLEKLALDTLEGVKSFQGDLVKNHRGRRDIFRIKTEGSPVLFLKRNWRPYKKNGFASFLQRGTVWSIAREEWENSAALERAGMPVAGLVAYGEACGLLWENFSFILTEAAPGQPMDEFIRECRDSQLRQLVFKTLGLHILSMHDAGFATPDLFTRHIFVNVGNNPPTFCLIDMARLNRRKIIPVKMRARDLAALNATAPLRFVSDEERKTFFKSYAQGGDEHLSALIKKRMEHLLKRGKYQDFLANGNAANRPLECPSGA
jgi:tRNA A-37 threonylcarbamoyl transferase component Bud32